MGRAFAIGVVLNTAFVLAEAGAGLMIGSLSLLADAGHNLSDVLSLLLAWGATILAKRAPSGRRTYGLRKATILASLGNAAMLMLAVGAITSSDFPLAQGAILILAVGFMAINLAVDVLYAYLDPRIARG